MSDGKSGILALVGACTIWGLSPLYYKLLAHIPPIEVLAHRTLWSCLFFAIVLAGQGRLRQLRGALGSVRSTLLVGAAALLIYLDPGDSGFVKGDVYPEGGWQTDACIQRGSSAAMRSYTGHAGW